MIKCKYAGDVNDECCKDCNGLTIIETNAKGEDVEIPCTECGGYEPEEATEEVEQDTAILHFKPDDIAYTMPDAVKALTSEETSETINNTTETEKSLTAKNTAEILEITAGTGISIELNGVWYKFDYSEKRGVNPNISIEEQRKELWDNVFNEVDNALADTKKSLGL